LQSKRGKGNKNINVNKLIIAANKKPAGLRALSILIFIIRLLLPLQAQKKLNIIILNPNFIQNEIEDSRTP